MSTGGIWVKMFNGTQNVWQRLEYTEITNFGDNKQGYAIWYRRNSVLEGGSVTEPRWHHVNSRWEDGVGRNDLYVYMTERYLKPGDLLTEDHVEWHYVNPPPGYPDIPQDSLYRVKLSRPSSAAALTPEDLPVLSVLAYSVSHGVFDAMIGSASTWTEETIREALAPYGVRVDFFAE